MVRDSKRRSKSLAKKKRKREDKKSRIQAGRLTQQAALSLRHAANWPIIHCCVNESWRKRKMATVVVVRERPDHFFLLGVFLVDLGCLGVKNAILQEQLPRDEIRSFLASISAEDDLIDCEPELAAKIVFAGVAYADSLGFLPHSDYKKARVVLQSIDPAACDQPIECGAEGGRPFYVPGPHDDIEAVSRQLARKFGARAVPGEEPPDPDGCGD